MSLLIKEINELRQRLKNFDAGNIDAKELTAAVSVYAQTEKRMRLFVQVLIMAQKTNNPKTLKLLGEMTEGDKIDVSDEPYNRTAQRGRKTK